MNDALIEMMGDRMNLLKVGDEFTIDFPANSIWETYRGKVFRVIGGTQNSYNLEIVREEDNDPDADLFE